MSNRSSNSSQNEEKSSRSGSSYEAKRSKVRITSRSNVSDFGQFDLHVNQIRVSTFSQYEENGSRLEAPHEAKRPKVSISEKSKDIRKSGNK